MKDYLSSGEFAKAVGVHPNTVRNWDNNGYLKPSITVRGRRYYTQAQVDSVIGSVDKDAEHKDN
jgi:DNA-binding transcriptional MerR regulator